MDEMESPFRGMGIPDEPELPVHPGMEPLTPLDDIDAADTRNAARLIVDFLHEAKAKPHRTMAQFAEREIILPDGPYQGYPFRLDTQPYARHFFDAVDSDQWSRVAAVGPTQSGKTTVCYVIPVLYHLFETSETVIAGVPSSDIAGDKWREDLEPMIKAAPDLVPELPKKGQGSRGGTVRTGVTFRSGVTLRFMSGGGDDKVRAAYTSRVVAITETDGMDEAGLVSREADKITQLEARTKAFGKGTGLLPRIYLECTASIPEGRIWQEYDKRSTRSELLMPCFRCGEYVLPEREHLKGWEGQPDQHTAGKKAYLECPECGAQWKERNRRAALKRMLLVHRGQRVVDGKVVGKPKGTDTLGFRWNAVHNAFITVHQLGEMHWTASKSEDEENAEKELSQFVWAKPYIPPELDVKVLQQEDVMNSTGGCKRGVVPKGTKHIAIGVDTGKRMCHWTAIAFDSLGHGIIFDYRTLTVPGGGTGTQALLRAFKKLHDYLEAGFPVDGREKPAIPDAVWIDAGYYEHTDDIYEFCLWANENSKVSGRRYLGYKGYGMSSEYTPNAYTAPKAITKIVRFLGHGYHITWHPRARNFLVHGNSDYWKTQLHDHFMSDGEMVRLFDVADPAEHTEFARQITAEVPKITFDEKKRQHMVVWQRIRRKNHYLDSTYMAMAAGAHAGVRLEPILPDEPTKPKRIGGGGWFAKQKLKK